MWFTKVVIEFAVPVLLILFILTQIILPAIFPSSFDFFWLFKKRKEIELPPTAPAQPGPKKSLDESVEELASELDADTQKLKQTKKVVIETIDKLSNALDEQTAQTKKHILELEGEGEGAKKRAIMQANGALEQKLATYENVQKMWADAFANYQGSLVPAYISGGNANGGMNAGTQFMEMLMMKTARDLNLDISNNAGGGAGKNKK